MGRPAFSPELRIQRKREAVSRYSAKKRVQMRTARDLAKNVPCADCGGQFPPECMDFDHVSGDKVGDLSNMWSFGEARLIAEIAKCELVCANCHRTRTKNRPNKRWSN